MELQARLGQSHKPHTELFGKDLLHERQPAVFPDIFRVFGGANECFDLGRRSQMMRRRAVLDVDNPALDGTKLLRGRKDLGAAHQLDFDDAFPLFIDEVDEALELLTPKHGNRKGRDGLEHFLGRNGTGK